MPNDIEDQRRWYVDGLFKYDDAREEWAALSGTAVLTCTRRKPTTVFVSDFDGSLLLHGTLDGGAGGGPGGRCVALRTGLQVVVVRFPSAAMLHNFVRFFSASATDSTKPLPCSCQMSAAGCCCA